MSLHTFQRKVPNRRFRGLALEYEAPRAPYSSLAPHNCSSVSCIISSAYIEESILGGGAGDFGSRPSGTTLLTSHRQGPSARYLEDVYN